MRDIELLLRQADSLCISATLACIEYGDNCLNCKFGAETDYIFCPKKPLLRYVPDNGNLQSPLQ